MVAAARRGQRLAPYENLRSLTRLHRVPATPEFDQAAEFMLARAKEYGLQDVHAEQFPIDGKIQYGLMRSHMAWHVEAARLWQIQPQHTLLGDWATDPIRLADYSHSADVEAPLVDVGAGTSESDYAGKDVRGKIVLADGVLATVQRLAVVKYGAAGIVSDMPNQSTAWSGLDTTHRALGPSEARCRTGSPLWCRAKRRRRCGRSLPRPAGDARRACQGGSRSRTLDGGDGNHPGHRSGG